MEFTREQFNKATTEFMMNYGDGEDESPVREDYSGRNMYGRECVGVVGESPATYVQFLFSLAEVLYEDDLYEQRDFILDMVERMSVDNMGRSAMIYYFPGYTVAD